MIGHPGMNNKGLAYVEHGGEMRMIEPNGDWGYGIRKGTSVFHVLRFANNAREALEMELSFPVGDVGQPMGSAGGFYADSTYGYVLESRSNPVIIREAGVMGESDFRYANNSAMHPEAWKAGWMQPDNGTNGYYALCVGTAARGLEPLTPTRAAPVYGETNAFWDIRLADGPMEITAAARQCAQEYIRKASLQLSKLNAAEVAFAPLADLLDLAQGELDKGLTHEASAETATGYEGVYEWAKATRCFTRAQVRALQVCQALVPCC